MVKHDTHVGLPNLISHALLLARNSMRNLECL